MTFASFVGFLVLYTQKAPGAGYAGAVLATMVYPTIAVELAWVGSGAGGDVRKGEIPNYAIFDYAKTLVRCHTCNGYWCREPWRVSFKISPFMIILIWPAYHTEFARHSSTYRLIVSTLDTA